MIKRIVLGLVLFALPAFGQAQLPIQAASNPNITTSSGTWTPADASGASLTFTAVSAGYTVIGNMVFVYGTLTYPVTGDSSSSVIGGLPFPVPNQNYAAIPAVVVRNGAFNNTNIVLRKNSSTFSLVGFSTGTAVTNVSSSGAVFVFSFSYPIT